MKIKLYLPSAVSVILLYYNWKYADWSAQVAKLRLFGKVNLNFAA
ncbi:hypothetical protein [Marivirga lumbricoides]